MDPYEITAQAIETNNLEKLLLGDAPYVYRDWMSPAPGPTDLTIVYRAICEYAKQHPALDLKNQVEQLFPQLLKSIQGIDAAAGVLFIEFSRRAHSQSNLGLNTNTLADMLKKGIRNHKDSLIKCKKFGGYGWPEGLLDDLRRQSRNLVELGGPAFVDV